MRKPTFVSPTNPIRSWARRIARSSQARPDVVVGQLARRLEVLEKLVVLPEGADRAVEEAVGLLTPKQFADVPLERVGSAHDGGYVLPRWLAARCSGVVSIGVGTNNDCDVALAERGLRVHAWDHTVPRLPREHPAITFHRIGLGTGEELVRLTDLVETSFGPTAAHLALLLDAEGAEWEALGEVAPGLLERFDVVAVELHDLGDIMLRPETLLCALRNLDSQFVPVAVHVNNHGAMWRIDRWDSPDALEVTYVRRSANGLVAREGNCPATLLAPCCVDLPDPTVSWLDAHGS